MMALAKHAAVGTLAIALMVGTLGFLRTYQHGEAPPSRESLRQLSLQIESWRGREVGLGVETARKLGVSDYTMRTYHNAAGHPVWLYIGYYQSQRQGETIHSPKNCYPGSGWETLSSDVVTLDIPTLQESPVRVNRYLIAKGLDKRLVFYWYQERGRVIASEYWAKFYLVLDAATRNRTDGALVRLSSVVSESVPATEMRLMGFMQQVFPLLSAYVPD